MRPPNGIPRPRELAYREPPDDDEEFEDEEEDEDDGTQSEDDEESEPGAGFSEGSRCFIRSGLEKG